MPVHTTHTRKRRIPDSSGEWLLYGNTRERKRRLGIDESRGDKACFEKASRSVVDRVESRLYLCFLMRDFLLYHSAASFPVSFKEGSRG